MPLVVKRRGRAKGHTLTVCGLPSKKNKKKAKCTSFISKHYTEKEKRYDVVNNNLLCNYLYSVRVEKSPLLKKRCFMHGM